MDKQPHARSSAIATERHVALNETTQCVQASLHHCWLALAIMVLIQCTAMVLSCFVPAAVARNQQLMPDQVIEKEA